MCAKQKSIEIYSLEDFRKADRLDRIRMHMIEPERFYLDGIDWQHYLDLEKAWLLVSGETRESVAIRLIQSGVRGAESWYKATRLLREVEMLYAPFLKRNREMQHARVVEKLYHYAEVAGKKAIWTDEEGNECVDQDWIQIAQKFLKDAAEMEGLNAANNIPFDPDDLAIGDIEITSDPAAFLEEQNAEYDDFEPLEGDEDEED